MYKTLHGMTPEYLETNFVWRDDVTTHRLRDDINKRTLPQSRTDPNCLFAANFKFHIDIIQSFRHERYEMLCAVES